MHDCPTCGAPTPDGAFCVRCGAPQDRALEHSHHRREFAAAPGERRYAPRIVTTLFPHLPRHSVRHFRIALLAGTALVALLGALHLFPVALIVAALLMPLLTLLYLYDVDIYEVAPVRAFAWTVLWGAVTGAATGALAKAIAPGGSALIDRSSAAHLLTGGILIPLIGVVLMLAGPLFLLRDRTFDSALDGASFGSVCAATFAAAQAVVVGVGVLSGGLRPIGAALPWVERLLSVAVALPVLSMSAIGSACAAIWLRYRAPKHDHAALGPLGQPALATLLAAALIVLGYASETFMAAGAWLVMLIALDVISLVLLRRALHIGLLEESLEREIGAPIRCANCGAMTPAHTFCSNCGVSLRALPRRRQPAGQPAAERGSFTGRLDAQRAGHDSGRRRLAAWGLALSVVVAAAFGIGALAAPPPRKPPCRPGVPCGTPPIVAQALFTFPGYTAWQSTGLGYALRYNKQWSIGSQSADAVTLNAAGGIGLIDVRAVRSSEGTPAAMIVTEVSALRRQLLGLAHDTQPADQILGTNVGLIPGPGAVYAGTVASPQGPQQPVSVVVLAASSDGLTIGVTVVAPGNNPGNQQVVYQQADDVINSIQFSTS